MDWHKLQHKLFALDPTDPREDLAKLKAAAQGGNSGAPVAKTVDYLNESAEVAEGSLKLDKEYSVSDFAALAGVKTAVSEKNENPFAPDAFEKGVKNWARRTFDPDYSAAPEPKSKSAPAQTDKNKVTVKTTDSRAWRDFLKQYTTQLQQIASDPEKKRRFDTWMSKWAESVEEAEVMKFKAPNTVKQRDPNWRDMEALRKSGAAGVHKDKKKDMKSGKVKHKSKEYESIKDMLYARLNEKK